MADCPFLSTFDNEIECFKECALFEWKESGGMCPFKNLTEYKLNKLSDFEDFFPGDKDVDYIKESILKGKVSI